jgi:dephospho-CoA kinase
MTTPSDPTKPLPHKPYVIGVTGYPGAGKDTFAAQLKEAVETSGRSAQLVSSGDLIRQYVRDNKLGDYGDRELLQKIASKVMAERGPEIWLEQAIAAAQDCDVLLYPGLRHPDELAEIHQNQGIVVVIDVPIEVRYQRSQRRKRHGDEMSFEEFKVDDAGERAGKGQQVEAVVAQADVIVQNDGDLAQLKRVAETIIASLPDQIKPRYDASTMEAQS